MCFFDKSCLQHKNIENCKPLHKILSKGTFVHWPLTFLCLAFKSQETAQYYQNHNKFLHYSPKQLFKERHERILFSFSEPNNNCQPDDILPKRTLVFCFLTFFAWPSKAKNPHNTTRITRIGTSFITHTTIVVIGPAKQTDGQCNGKRKFPAV